MSLLAPSRPLDAIRTAMRILLVALALLATVLYLRQGLQLLDREQAAQSRVGKVLVFMGGDVAHRDIPKAHEMLRGGFLSDPYYLGESHWYPFLTPALAALGARITGRDLPDVYFRLGIIATSVYMLGAAYAVVALGGPSSVALVPLAVLAGWLEPGQGVYPGESVRGLFLVFLVLAGWIWKSPRSRSPFAYWLLGTFVGVFCLWHGASFILAAGLSCVLLLPLTAHGLRRGFSRDTVLRILLVPAGAIPSMLLLFGPQLLRYGRLVFPAQAATWVAPYYENHYAIDALRLALVPRDAGWLLLVAFLVRVLFPKPLGSPRWRLAQPLLLVLVVTLFAGHAGFLLADEAHPDLAKVTRALLPVPPHTFWTVALSLLPVCKALGLFVVVQVVWYAIARGTQRASVRLRAVVDGLATWGPRLLALALMAVVPFRLPAFALAYTSTHDRAFYDYTKKVAVLLDDSPVYFRYPGHFLQGGALKIPVLSVEVFANPYVHSERDTAVSRLEVAAAAGDMQAANGFFETYGVRYLMQDPRASRDPVIVHCAGPVVTEYAGYVLRKFEGCRR